MGKGHLSPQEEDHSTMDEEMFPTMESVYLQSELL